MFRLLLLLVLVISVVNIIQSRKIETENYTIWTIPDSASDVSGMKTEGGVAMIGGGSDCYPAFSWLIDHGNGGDFVVLRAGGTDAYNQFVYDLSVTLKKPLNSVTTISWNNREASFDEEVLTLLRNAEVIFFSGGDQYKYIQYWSDTPVQSIIQEKLLNGVSIGGTSAGLAIQGNFIYSAANGSVYSDDNLYDPYNIWNTFSGAFLRIPFLDNVITDTHFHARERMGRMLTFLARITKGDAIENQSTFDAKSYRAVALDEVTALLLNVETGHAQAVGENHAYICQPSRVPEVCESDIPLTFKDINCIRLSASDHDTYDFPVFDGSGVHYVNTIVDGKYVNSDPYGP